MTAPDRSDVAALLDAELHDARFRDPRYLGWLYDENPVGDAVEGTARDQDGRPVAHYALVPQRWRSPRGVERFDISLHAVVRADEQRRGRFRALAGEVYDRAALAGARGTVTVANGRSTPAFVEHLGFTRLGSLPVTVCVPVPGRAARVTSTAVDAAAPDGACCERLAALASLTPTNALVQDWTADTLRWRLSNPTASYVVHEGDDVVGISCRAAFGPAPFAVVVKLWARTPTLAGTASRPSAAPVVAAACRAHRAPLAVHAGWNPHVGVRGMRAPRRVLPSPLNLVVRAFDPALSPSDLRVGVYEFLDADHY